MKLSIDDDEADLLLLALQPIIAAADEDTCELAHAIEQRIVRLLPPPRETAIEAVVSTDPQTFPGLFAKAMSCEGVVELDYADKNGRASRRRICPVILYDDDPSGLIVAFCLLRQDFRQFRLDRMRSVRPTSEAYPSRLRLLRAKWLSIAGFDDLEMW